MNTRDLINSGIVESYLLGFASREEQLMIREKALTDDDFNHYLVDIENDVRAYFSQTSVTPPAPLREVIVLRSGQGEPKKQKHVFQHGHGENRSGQYHEIEVNDTHIKVHKLWRPAFIAVFILSKIFLIAGLYFYFKSQSMQDELSRLKLSVEATK